MKQPLTLIKVGGKIVEDPSALAALLDRLAGIEGLKVLVHGGGRSATRLAGELGIKTVMIDGRRVTDSETLRVVTMVYAGLVNKSIVAGLQARGVNAAGVTGADLNLIVSDRRKPVNGVDYGYVGDVRHVSAEGFRTLLDSGVMPVVAPLSHDGKGSMLNTNADTIASSVARGLAGLYDVTLVYCFEKPGVLADPDDDSSVIPLITPGLYAQLRADGVVTDGMIPKLDNAFAAIAEGVSRVVITAASSLDGGGTTISN